MPRTAEDEAIRSRTFMQRPVDWPLWPLLPVKRQHREEDGIEVGVMRPGQPVVYLTGLRQVREHNAERPLYDCLAKTERVSYDDYQGVTDAGWRVD